VGWVREDRPEYQDQWCWCSSIWNSGRREEMGQ
jgi:hypothetical protein